MASRSRLDAVVLSPMLPTSMIGADWRRRDGLERQDALSAHPSVPPPVKSDSSSSAALISSRQSRQRAKVAATGQLAPHLSSQASKGEQHDPKRIKKRR